MDQFRAGRVRARKDIGVDYPADTIILKPEEMPDFIRKQWGYTNGLGDIFPVVEIILKNRQPSYVVLNWWDWGVVVDPLESDISFGCGGSNKISPGIYTYYGSFYVN